MKKILFAISIFTCFCFAACKKHHSTPKPDNPYGLPNATQTGAGVFACRVNGQNWISKQGSNFIRGMLDTSNKKLAISGFYDRIMAMEIDNYSQSFSNYQLNDTINSYGAFQVNNSCLSNPSGGYGGVTLIKSVDGMLVLTKVDIVSKVLSGSFWFNIKTELCDTIRITDGRFDIRYY